MAKMQIAPSTDPFKSEEEIIAFAKEIQTYADLLHVDCMDGEFVSRKTVDHEIVKKLSDQCLLMLDVHLMEQKPQIEKYIKAGASFITLHYESFKSDAALIATLKKIRQSGLLAGISIKPSTHVTAIINVIKYADLLLLMSVEPGESGQKFNETVLQKVIDTKVLIESQNLRTKIEVDGGINPDNAKKLKELGVDILVSGSYVACSNNKQEAIRELKGE